MKRYSHGLRAQVSYTLAKSIDDSSGINSQDYDSVVQYGLDWYDPTYDRGPSAFQARHNVTFTGAGTFHRRRICRAPRPPC